uniref:Uncharacterized protein n=1 Tax=Fagus sylvatica TaxID=28930 RepID=A0A2N9H6S5_FAGSY
MWKFQKCSGGFHFLDYSVNGRLYWESVIHLSYAFSFPTSVEIAMQCIAKNGTAGPGSKPRIPPLGSETLGFGQKHDATVDIPLDTMNDSKSKVKELAAWEADLKRREKVSAAIP